MGIFDLFGKKEVSQNESYYSIKTELHPFRLYAHKNDYVNLQITLKNNFQRELLTSLVLIVPRGLGFEQSALSTQKEIRIGMLKAGEEKTFKIPIWATQRTDAGDYKIKIFAIAHYHDYAYVLNESRKIITLRVA
ncbi:MAG: hypothetical protein ACP5O3_03825 [Candidatus Micrarchaeia archaeon]